MKAPKCIYLIDTGDEIVWSDDPEPTNYIDSEDVVAYVRTDEVKRMEDALNRIITSVNNGWYKSIAQIARKALKDD